MRNATTQTAAKIVLILCLVGTFLAFAFDISFYYRDLPSKPQPEVGRIYPLNNHGYYTYMTKREEVQQEISDVVFAVLFLIAILIDRFLDPFDRRKEEQFIRNQRPPWTHRWGP